jgi:hypothetical protein
VRFERAQRDALDTLAVAARAERASSAQRLLVEGSFPSYRSPRGDPRKALENELALEP